MPLKMPFAVLKFLVILALFMALEVSARELLETSNSLGPCKFASLRASTAKL
ncbi:hypothetical protein RHGRI_003849 [Rhododendron griersonianum]|uniref:Uncharacterized protein n=1 Tax=Rhododendron griersonianum TaxID=479676 RepID=A0AAV6L8A6_9ERIC|nr:hypothetical protein RHGRI_003849 [Rhododendron griersonianum]